MATSLPRSAVVLGAVLGCGLCLRAADDPPKLPDGVTPVTKGMLISRVPNFFFFDYPFDPHPGKRLWLRVDDEHFVERYPDGTQSRYRIIGHATVRGMDGTITSKISGNEAATQTSNNGSFQVFVPDKGGAEMAILFRIDRGPDAEWRDMSWSQNRKTIIDKVE
jgi:hypothetical protein